MEAIKKRLRVIISEKKDNQPSNKIIRGLLINSSKQFKSIMKTLTMDPIKPMSQCIKLKTNY